MEKLTFEEQTERIVEALLYDFDVSSDPSETAFRGLQLQSGTTFNTDCSASSFDAATIASTLRRIGDQYNEEVELQAEMIIGEDNMLEKFKEMAESISRNSGLEYEQAFLAVSVKLFLCLARKARAIVQPDLLMQAINNNHAVRVYIEMQGGWENFGNRQGQNNH